MLKAIHAQESKKASREKAKAVVAELRAMKLKEAAKKVEDGISAYGVLMYVQFVFIAIDIGYSIGCAPIVGFHFGAQNHAELKNMLGKSVKLMCGAGVVMAVLAQVLAAPLARLFVGYDEGLYTLTCHAFRLFSFAFLFAGFNIFASSFFTALNNGLISAGFRQDLCAKLFAGSG